MILKGGGVKSPTLLVIFCQPIMGATNFDTVGGNARVKVVSSLPTTPYDYYGVGQYDVNNTAWVGGEFCYNTADNRIYIQRNTSGLTASWRRLLTQFATTTTTSTSTSTSTTTSSTSSSSTTTMA